MVTAAWGRSYISAGTKTNREEGEQRAEGRREEKIQRCVISKSFVVGWRVSSGNLRQPCPPLELIWILSPLRKPITPEVKGLCLRTHVCLPCSRLHRRRCCDCEFAWASSEAVGANHDIRNTLNNTPPPTKRRFEEEWVTRRTAGELFT